MRLRRPTGPATATPNATVAAFAIAFLLVSAPSTIVGQYFGRNKVQYDDFDFQIYRSEHFDVHFYPEEEEAVREAARMAERWQARYAPLFDHSLTERKPIILYADDADFQQTNVIEGMIGEGVGGVTEGLRHRLVMPLTGIPRETDHVLGHELVHVFQYDIAKASGAGLTRMSMLPLWWIEGMAEYLSIGRKDTHTSMWLRDAVLRDDIPTLRQLERDARYFPYRYGQAVWAYVAGRWGDAEIQRLYRTSLRHGVDSAFVRVLGLDSDSLSKDWVRDVRAACQPLLEGRARPKDAGRRVVSGEMDGGDLNLAPAVSPDGRTVAFLSERDVFTFDLYLADAKSGRVLRKLLSQDADPHLDALRFINSAGAWSHDGLRFALVVFAEGDNEIAIVDVESGDIERRYRLKEAGAITNPAWSPDGRYLAFAGSAGGESRIYLLDLETGQSRKLFDDGYACLQPTWSPDARILAYVTDRSPEADPERLAYGRMQIGLYDLETESGRALRLFDDGDHANPQFSPDGADLYFLSDPDGFRDIYRVSLETGAISQVTRLATGVSGITMLSPALSVAPSTGDLFFSVFDHGRYDIYALPPPEARGEPVSADRSEVAGVLPPREPSAPVLVDEYLDDPATGLASQSSLRAADYHSSLRLQYVAQASIGVSVGGYGSAIGGGATMVFGDLLGNHLLGVGIQSNGGFKDLGGEAIYQNRKNRWNWSVGAAHLPYLTGVTTAKEVLVTTVGPDSVKTTLPGVLYVQELQRTYLDGLTVSTQYPLSMTRRFELGVGITHQTFDRDVDSLVTVDGFEVYRHSVNAEAPPGFTLYQSLLAYVHDTSYFAFTSPAKGTRYRLELAPTFGRLQYWGLLGDYRRYVFLRPVTFAMRGLHYGRYGPDADDTILSPLFIGYPTLVRGYDAGSLDLSECTGESASNCPEFDRLIGTRIAVANLEMRVPIFGSEDLGLISWPMFPLEIAPFMDAGMAWSGGDPPTLRFARRSSERIPVFSTGASARINLFGYIVAEGFYAYPFQRPERGGHFGFQIAAGW